MSFIHYKFRSALDYKRVTFDTLHIGVEDLKKAICDQENIRIESFDLKLTNAHTKRSYGLEELVPRNSSVIVQRTPRENALKLPKVQYVILNYYMYIKKRFLATLVHLEP